MLHQYFRSPEEGGAIRSYYLAKALAEAGHRVVIITSYAGKGVKTELLDGFEIRLLPVPYDNRFSFTARSIAFARFVTLASKHAAAFRDFDLCYAISVPLTVGIIARWIKFRYNIPFYFEVGDLWPEAPVQLGFVRNIFLKKSLYALEKSIYKAATEVVALSPAIQHDIQKKVPHKRVHLVPNMSDCEFYYPAAKDPLIGQALGLDGKFVVSYIGALGVANGLDYFIECAVSSQNAGLPVHFILCGDGAMLDYLKANVRMKGLSNISIIDFVNRQRVRDLLNVTDASFVCYKNVPVLETGSPNKFFDGLAAGKLMIINFGGWIRKEIEDNQCGIYVDPREPEDFVNKIKPFLSEAALLQQYQAASRDLAERKYSRQKLSRVFSGIFA